MTDKSIWNQEIPVPVEAIQVVDPGVLEKLPAGIRIRGISASGASYWARTAKIDAVNEAGEATPFFIKVHQNDVGRDMASSEYEAASTLYAVVPEMVAEPIAWGPYRAIPNTWFYACRYRRFKRTQDDKKDGIPPPASIVPRLVELHTRGQCADAQFGALFTTYGGPLPVLFHRADTWEEAFAGALAGTFQREQATQGPDPELDRLREDVLAKVVPRLLRPLQTGGRSIVPTLLHGDLWDGNMSVDASTGRPVVFDAQVLYGHNEYELAPWWAPRHEATDAYIDEYVKQMGKSEPQEDFVDRGLLYRLRFDLQSSALYPGNLMFRRFAMDAMRHLVDKYSRRE